MSLLSLEVQLNPLLSQVFKTAATSEVSPPQETSLLPLAQ